MVRIGRAMGSWGGLHLDGRKAGRWRTQVYLNGSIIVGAGVNEVQILKVGLNILKPYSVLGFTVNIKNGFDV